MTAEEKLKELTVLRQKGAALLHKGRNEIKNDTEKDKWWQETETWKNNVRSIMHKIHIADPDNWAMLGTYYVLFSDLYSEDMNAKATQLSLRLEKLREYIDERTKRVNKY